MTNAYAVSQVCMHLEHSRLESVEVITMLYLRILLVWTVLCMKHQIEEDHKEEELYRITFKSLYIYFLYFVNLC